MNTLERIFHKIISAFGIVGAIAYLIMLFVNVSDVFGSKFFKFPFPGGIEIISFAQVVAIVLTIPIGLIEGFHVRLELLIEKLKGFSKDLVEFAATIICGIFFILIFIESILYGYALQKSGEIGSVSKLPFYPFVYVISLSCFVVILYYLLKTVHQLRRGRSNNVSNLDK